MFSAEINIQGSLVPESAPEAVQNAKRSWGSMPRAPDPPRDHVLTHTKNGFAPLISYLLIVPRPWEIF